VSNSQALNQNTSLHCSIDTMVLTVISMLKGDSLNALF